MTTLQILKAGRELINDPLRWTKESYARDASGLPCRELDPKACCWCSLGALCKSSLSKKTRSLALHALQAEMTDVLDFNDNHTHAEVIAAWDRAIEKCEQST